MSDTNLLEDQPIAWTPTPDVIERSRLMQFMRQVGVETWDELYEFSIRDVEKFTEEVLRFLDIKFDPRYEKLLDTTQGVEFPVWFRSADTPVRMEAAAASREDFVDEPNGFRDAAESVIPSLAGGTGDADKSVRAPSAGLNITTMCLDRWQTDEMKDQPAVIWEGEDGSEAALPYKELSREIKSCTAGLRARNLGKGDAIGIHMPMIPETVIALLAINRIGAIAVPVFSGYGVEAIASRMNAVGAKALFTCPYFTRRGKQTQTSLAGFEAASKCPALKYVFLVPASTKPPPNPLKPAELSEESRRFIDAFKAMSDEERAEYQLTQKVESERTRDEFFIHLKKLGASETKIDEIRQQIEAQPSDVGVFSFVGDISKTRRERSFRVHSWRELLDAESVTATDSPIEATSAEDPLIILYTSGTTGKPKGIAHTHASFPIKAAQDMAFGTDVGRGTRICWYTDIGWMMGPWLIYGALINGATICIYDGAPDYPTPDRMWEFCAKHRVEVLGISPTLIRALAAAEGSADTPVRKDAAAAFRENDPIERRGWYRHKLPHYDGNVTQFITFRLADSLPQHVVEGMKFRLDHDKHTEFSEEFRRKVDEYLDSGAGDCLLRDPAAAQLVEETILAEHGQSCDVRGWVIMPNHVHILLSPHAGNELAGIMKRMKGVSARKINQLLERSGSVWQADYFDRYIRDEDDFHRKLEYIEDNPVTAGLVKDARSWRFSSAWSAEYSKTSFAGGTGDADKSVRAPFQRHDLSSLRAFASTGEPWNPAPWWWLFEKVGNSKLPIINYSGGTEIAGGILMGNPLLPMKPCSFPAPCPGMDVDILDEDGKPVEPGKVGELVIKQPWIGMARGFWQEEERYLDTYWRRFKDIWVHGDWAMRDKDGHWFILGRSDDTLKVAGKRVGPAEVESLLVAHPEVTEAAVIGVPDEVKGTAMVAFCVVSPGQAETRRVGSVPNDAEALAKELKALVAKDMGKPLAPSKIHFVAALPKTRNAKVMRRVIRAAYLGEDPGDLSALEDPNSVDAIAAAKEPA